MKLNIKTKYSRILNSSRYYRFTYRSIREKKLVLSNFGYLTLEEEYQNQL